MYLSCLKLFLSTSNLFFIFFFYSKFNFKKMIKEHIDWFFCWIREKEILVPHPSVISFSLTNFTCSSTDRVKERRRRSSQFNPNIADPPTMAQPLIKKDDDRDDECKHFLPNLLQFLFFILRQLIKSCDFFLLLLFRDLFE